MIKHLKARGVEPLSLSHSFNIPSRKKAANCGAKLSQVHVLAAKIEFAYGAGQTVNLLALRLQWFESTPAQVSLVRDSQAISIFSDMLH